MKQRLQLLATFILLLAAVLIDLVRAAPTTLMQDDANLTQDDFPLTQETNRSAGDCYILPTSKWESCCHIQQNMTASGANISNGVYSLDHFGPFSTTYGYCDLETDGGGWLVILRRQGQFDFNRALKSYEDGFGTLKESNTFWYGLKALSHLTNRSGWELRVDMVDSGHEVHAVYSNISIGDASEGYRLTLGPYVPEKSTAGDSLHVFNGNMFYTWDNDGPAPERCAHGAGGGWWYTSGECGGQRGGILTAKLSHLRGWYSEEVDDKVTYDLIEMKIRSRTDCLEL